MIDNNFDICFEHTVRSADRVLTQFYNEYLAPTGIRATQFSILRALKLLDQATAKDLLNILVLEQATISRALKPLLRDGYIQESQGEDKRQKHLSLTIEGNTLYEQAEVLWSEAQASIKKRLGQKASQELLDVCDKILMLK